MNTYETKLADRNHQKAKGRQQRKFLKVRSERQERDREYDEQKKARGTLRKIKDTPKALKGRVKKHLQKKVAALEKTEAKELALDKRIPKSLAGLENLSEKEKSKEINKRSKKISQKAKQSKRDQFSLKLYSNAAILGYRRSLVRQYPNQSLLRIEGVTTRHDTKFYLGKRCVYVSRAKKPKINQLGLDGQRNKKMTRVRCVWGKICRPHGNGGVVRARFSKNLTPKAMGRTVRVMLYPSKV